MEDDPAAGETADGSAAVEAGTFDPAGCPVDEGFDAGTVGGDPLPACDTFTITDP